MDTDYKLGFNLRKVINLGSKNLTEYIKGDAKYLLLPFLSLFIIFNSMAFFILNLYNYNYISPLGSLILFLFGIILYIFSLYLITWLNATKAYHTVQEYMDDKNSYSKSLEHTKNKKMRPFIATLITFIIVFVIVLVLYSIVFLLLIMFLRSPTALFTIIWIGEFGPILIIAFLFAPLQLYPSLVLIEDNLGYKEGISRSYQLLSGWQAKLKFIVLYYLLNYISSIPLGLLFVGVFIGSLILTVFLAGIFSGVLLGAVVIEMFIIVFSLFIVISIEVSGIVSGIFFGQSYINLAHPELMPPPKMPYYAQPATMPAASTPAKYCVNCGQALDETSVFCPNCGAPVKNK